MARPQQPQFQNSHQELSLYSHITSLRQPQILRIISGITGMLPDTSLHHTLVFKPKRPKQLGPGGSTELYYVHLVSRIDETQEAEGKSYDVRKQKWTMTLEDIPEPTRKPVTSRSVLSSDISEGDAVAFMESLGYTFQAAYFTKSERLVHNNVIIKLTQILIPPNPPAQDNTVTPSADEMLGNPFPVSALTPLDPAKSWILKASVRVQSNQDVENLNVGANELKGFKELMKGMCDLEAAERLALDTRVR
ncbi:mediator complex, subunit Med18 [Morchella snyderi]|nr:mediator complex, subunit Med18 [Morchella snyderi]